MGMGQVARTSQLSYCLADSSYLGEYQHQLFLLTIFKLKPMAIELGSCNWGEPEQATH